MSELPKMFKFPKISKQPIMSKLAGLSKFQNDKSAQSAKMFVHPGSPCLLILTSGVQKLLKNGFLSLPETQLLRHLLIEK